MILGPDGCRNSWCAFSPSWCGFSQSGCTSVQYKGRRINIVGDINTVLNS